MTNHPKRSRVMTNPRGIGLAERRERVRGVATKIVDEVVRICGEDARDRRIELVTIYLTELINKAADGAIARMTSKLTDEERAELYRRMTGDK